MQQKMGIKVLPFLLFEIKVKVEREAAEQSWDLLDKDEDQLRLAGIQLSFTTDNFATDNITTSVLHNFISLTFISSIFLSSEILFLRHHYFSGQIFPENVQQQSGSRYSIKWYSPDFLS